MGLIPRLVFGRPQTLLNFKKNIARAQKRTIYIMPDSQAAAKVIYLAQNKLIPYFRQSDQTEYIFQEEYGILVPGHIGVGGNKKANIL